MDSYSSWQIATVSIEQSVKLSIQKKCSGKDPKKLAPSMAGQKIDNPIPTKTSQHLNLNKPRFQDALMERLKHNDRKLPPHILPHKTKHIIPEILNPFILGPNRIFDPLRDTV